MNVSLFVLSFIFLQFISVTLSFNPNNWYNSGKKFCEENGTKEITDKLLKCDKTMREEVKYVFKT
jgi:hypothetical protein